MSLAVTAARQAAGTGDPGPVVPAPMAVRGDHEQADPAGGLLTARRPGGADVGHEDASLRVGGPRAGPSPSGGRGRVALVLRSCVVLIVIGLVVATVALRVELGDRRADAREAATAEARVADGNREAIALAEAAAAQLVQAHAHGDVSAAARAAQVARLAELGLTEHDMEQALDDAQEASAALEGRRDALSIEVERQAVEDAELQSCLREVRQAVDAAFHAADREGVEVPATREICRALAGVR